MPPAATTGTRPFMALASTFREQILSITVGLLPLDPPSNFKEMATCL